MENKKINMVKGTIKNMSKINTGRKVRMALTLISPFLPLIAYQSPLFLSKDFLTNPLLSADKVVEAFKSYPIDFFK